MMATSWPMLYKNKEVTSWWEKWRNGLVAQQKKVKRMPLSDHKKARCTIVSVCALKSAGFPC